MSGIDRIVRQIEDDTKTVCDDMILKARSKAGEIIAEAKKEADRISDDGQKNVQNKVADIKKRGESAAALEEKKVALYTKQSIISDMLAIGVDNVKSLPDEEYFALILKMIANSSQGKDGEIRFSQKDAARLPKDFMSKVNAVSKGKLTLSGSFADIDAGFVLVYGGIEENCSFDAIFASEKENLSDRAGKLLF